MLSAQDKKEVNDMIKVLLRSRIVQKKTNDTPREKFDLVNKGYTDQAYSSGSGAPSSTPLKLGYIYVDTSGKKVYLATGIGSSSDWTVVN